MCLCSKKWQLKKTKLNVCSSKQKLSSRFDKYGQLGHYQNEILLTGLLTTRPLVPAAPAGPEGPGIPRGPGKPGAPATPGRPYLVKKRKCIIILFCVALVKTFILK